MKASEVKETPEVLICDCHSREHQIIIQYDFDDNMVWCSIHLSSHSFWSRLKYGFKYIFGYKCRFGAFDEFIFKIEDADRLIELGKLMKKYKK